MSRQVQRRDELQTLKVLCQALQQQIVELRRVYAEERRKLRALREQVQTTETHLQELSARLPRP